MTPSLLQTIVAATRRAVEERERRMPLVDLESTEPPARRPGALKRALESEGPGGGAKLPRIIAECKRRSPSKGVLRAAYDPAAIAKTYEANGAAAISVLTEPTFFDGALSHLTAVRAAVSIPVLRKDFIVSRYQIAEARAAGADAILLIVAALDSGQLVPLLTTAREYGLDALVEAHDAREVEQAVNAGASIIGVNSRNLHTLEVDTEVLHAVAEKIPREVIAVAESGIRDAAMIRSLQKAGYRGFLIGERFMTEDDPGAALRGLLDSCREAERSEGGPASDEARRGVGVPAGESR